MGADSVDPDERPVDRSAAIWQRWRVGKVDAVLEVPMATHRLLYLVALLAGPALVAQEATLPFDAFTTEQADELVNRTIGPASSDDTLTAIGAGITAYTTLPDGLTLSFRLLDATRPVALALPNGSVYLSRGLVEAVGAEPAKLAFLCATEAALVADGRAQADPNVIALVSGRAPGEPLPDGLLRAVEETISEQRVLLADQEAMLCLARDGISPLTAVRTIEDLARTGYRHLLATEDLPEPITWLERKTKAMVGHTLLVEAATEFDFGVMDLVAKQYEAAIGRFEHFLAVFPANYAGWNNLGLCWYHVATRSLPPRMFLLADAIAQFDTSFMHRKAAFLDRPAWERAREAYQKALALNPRGAEALCNLGNLYLCDDQSETAVEYYERALAARPGFAQALNNLGVAIVEAASTDVPGEALVKFAAAAEADPTLPEAQYNLGLARAETGMPGAETAYRRYLALAPNGVRADLARRALGAAPPAQPGGEREQPVAGPPGIEREIELWARTRLALETRERDLLAMVELAPDQKRAGPGGDVEVCGWSAQGLVVELVRGKVNRVLAGRPPGHEAKTLRGVEVGYSTQDVKERYGLPPAVSRQNPYDIWLYPRTGLGFFVLGERVNKIFLFPVSQ